MQTEKVTFKISSVCPLILHNGQMANPMNPIVRAIKPISGKRKKTDADFEKMAELEFKGSLYMDADGPVIPAEMFEGAIHNAAKTQRLGKQVKGAVFCEGNGRLEYDGPRSADDLWADESFRNQSMVSVQQSKVLRTRPQFDNWSTEITVCYDAERLNKEAVIDFVNIAGFHSGLGDWRPKFGRFKVDEIS